jgi:hypothetical protein
MRGSRHTLMWHARLACAALATVLAAAAHADDEAKLSGESDSKRWWQLGDDGGHVNVLQARVAIDF